MPMLEPNAPTSEPKIAASAVIVAELMDRFTRIASNFKKIHDRCEPDWIEAGASRKQSVNFWLRPETLGIFWLDTATV